MSIRPSFQFYPSDWRNNVNLRKCTPTQRGAWIDLLCFLHQSDEYGVVRVGLKFVASWSGVGLKNVRALAKNNVLKGSDSNFSGYVYTPRTGGRDGTPVTLLAPCVGPCWFSSRFVRDEYVRTRRGFGVRFTSDNQPQHRHQLDELVRHQSDELVHGLASPIGRMGTRMGDESSSSSSIESPERESKTDRPWVGEISPTRRIGEKKTGTRWPQNAQVPRGWIEAANDKRHDLGLADADLAVEAEMFANYWTGKAGANATKLDWFKTWINWSLKANNAKGSMNGHGKPSAHAQLLASGVRALDKLRQRDEREREREGGEG